MNRRTFLKAASATGLASGLSSPASFGYIPEHNWEKYDWGNGPDVKDRLYQGAFPQYGPAAVVPDSDVVMVTTPSKEIVPNYGMGLTVYVSGDTGPPRIPGETLEKSLQDLIKIPFAQKIYLRPNWRDVQKRPGKLDSPVAEGKDMSRFITWASISWRYEWHRAESWGSAHAGPYCPAKRNHSFRQS